MKQELVVDAGVVVLPPTGVLASERFKSCSRVFRFVLSGFVCFHANQSLEIGLIRSLMTQTARELGSLFQCGFGAVSVRFQSRLAVEMLCFGDIDCYYVLSFRTSRAAFSEQF